MKRLLLLLDSMMYFDRQVLQGIKAKLDETKLKVSLHLESGTALDELTQESWDYIIADYDKRQFRRIVRTCEAKTLVYSNHYRHDFAGEMSSVVVDNTALANAALRRFIEARPTCVSFFANEQDAQQPWGQERKAAFEKLISGTELAYAEDIFAAIKARQFPVGVYCSSDRAARKLAQYCAHHCIEVPGEVSIIGTDCDDTERLISPLPLSSVDLNPYELGRFCVDTLIKMIRFKRRLRLTYSPTRFFEAATTIHHEKTDDLVSQAELFIQNNFHSNIKIKQVTDHCRISRKTLDSRFLIIHGITAHQYLTKIRLKRAKYLLRHTKDTLDSVAHQCGYPGQSYLTQVFSKEVGLSPSKFRQQFLSDAVT
ncbi:helix-turn-helix domain-containing protein [Vibrio quintilis]|uniref:Xylose operon regulatory protein n=1 Tax=Vibrio quintilis TaxID=1117707 RepID=A0A1M7YUD8_9VIBR|nr:helix-turn-helix domain-containing protein [Vibrio quintilis]SHO56205.1 Xylose operon regulatory protein [Vibrio quintilis]